MLERFGRLVDRWLDDACARRDELARAIRDHRVEALLADSDVELGENDRRLWAVLDR